MPQYQARTQNQEAGLGETSPFEALQAPSRRALREEIEQCRFLAESFPLLSNEEERAVLIDLEFARKDLIAQIVTSPLAVRHMYSILAENNGEESDAKLKRLTARLRKFKTHGNSVSKEARATLVTAAVFQFSRKRREYPIACYLRLLERIRGDLSTRPRLTPWDRDLENAWKRYGEVRSTLVNANLRQALKAAKRLKTISGRLSFGDLFQEATMALMDAADRFDRARAGRFMSYSYYSAFNRLRRSVWESRLIHYPQDWAKEFGANNEAPPRKKLRSAILSSDLTADEDNKGGASEKTFDVLPVSQELEAPERAESNELLSTTFGAMRSILSEGERKAITLRYGLPRKPGVQNRLGPLTMRETAAVLGLHHERVNQLQKRGEEKLVTLSLIMETGPQLRKRVLEIMTPEERLLIENSLCEPPLSAPRLLKTLKRRRLPIPKANGQHTDLERVRCARDAALNKLAKNLVLIAARES